MVAAVVASAACGTHVLVGNEDHPSDVSRPVRDAGSPGGSANADAGEIVCGSDICRPRELGGGFGLGPPCCYDVTKCGARFSNVCVELDSPGVPDTDCPSAGTYPGCCRSDDTCGIVATDTAFGCVDPFNFFPTRVLGICRYPKP